MYNEDLVAILQSNLPQEGKKGEAASGIAKVYFTPDMTQWIFNQRKAAAKKFTVEVDAADILKDAEENGVAKNVKKVKNGPGRPAKA